MTNLAIFASGRGTNTEAIINHFRNSTEVKVALIVCNNPYAGVLDVAKKFQIPVALVSKKSFYKSHELTATLKQNHIHFIVLAGFLWLVPKYLLELYPHKIINIHPALLPKHGGKGMYGRNVHEAVVQAKENETGITIHYVNEHFDKGEIIFQTTCNVEQSDTAERVEANVRRLELEFYPKAIEQLLIKQPIAI
ncbi:MAG: phosphoribosylglycinamide formyltransferase [Chitinophagales bacterium]|nr:phosphoribosylglycinamide formyltransferase [Chitinophagales bacterium]